MLNLTRTTSLNTNSFVLSPTTFSLYVFYPNFINNVELFNIGDEKFRVNISNINNNTGCEFEATSPTPVSFGAAQALSFDVANLQFYLNGLPSLTDTVLFGNTVYSVSFDRLVEVGSVDLDNLGDVLITPPLNDNDVLTYKTATQKWQNEPAPTGGEVNDGANVGAQAGQVFRDKTGVDLNFKTLGAGSNKLTLTNNTDDIILDVDEGNLSIAYSQLTGVPDLVTATNIGVAGVGLYKEQVAGEIRLKKLNVASAKLTVANDVVNDEVDLDLGLVSVYDLDNVAYVNPWNSIQTTYGFNNRWLNTGISLAPSLTWTDSVAGGVVERQYFPNMSTVTEGPLNRLGLRVNQGSFMHLPCATINDTDFTIYIVIKDLSVANQGRVIGLVNSALNSGSGIDDFQTPSQVALFCESFSAGSGVQYATQYNSGEFNYSFGFPSFPAISSLIFRYVKATTTLTCFVNGVPNSITVNLNGLNANRLMFASRNNTNGVLSTDTPLTSCKFFEVGVKTSALSDIDCQNLNESLYSYFIQESNVNRQTLIYNSVAEEYSNDFIKLTDCSDVSKTTPLDGEILTYRSSLGKWVGERSYASCYQYLNATNTPLTLNVPAVLQGATTAGLLSSDFTHTSPNKLTYTGAITKNFNIQYSLTGDTASNDRSLYVYLGRSGVALQDSYSLLLSKDVPADSDNVSGGCLCTLSTNQYIELYVMNIENSDDFVSLFMNVRINQL